MRCAQTFFLIAMTTWAQTGFSGQSALDFTAAVVALGPRPVDSPAHRAMEALVVSKLKSFGCSVQEDVWMAQTPLGPKRMNNIIARAGSSGSARAKGRVAVLTGHYDTKLFTDFHFVGANDAGSSTGLLLEMARVLCGRRSLDEVWLIWLDGEEALRTWTATDSLYGSRRLASQWRADGTASRIKALINVDMIGDRDLALIEELNSTDWLRKLVWDTAAEAGYARHFPRDPGAIEDDHIPFLQAGIPALDLIDFEYGPSNSYWHTERDTVDKLSAGSFEVIGNVLLKTLAKLGGK
jgi:hypothetical protein